MKKVLVIGCPGAGKSVFSRRLSRITGIPVCHMDVLYHNPDATHVENDEMDRRISKAMEPESWILDGNYARTISWRLKEADTVYYLDLPVEVCLQSIQDRIGLPRDDLPWQEDSLDPEFYEYVKQFPQNQKLKVDAALEQCDNREIIRFTSREEVNEYLDRLENDYRNL
jgi:adenylate kinase family enzyme